MGAVGRVAAFGLVTCLLWGTGAQASYRAIPLPEVTERTDVWVHGRLVSVEFQPLEEDERHRFDHTGHVEVRARMQVTDSVPPLDESEITLHCATREEFKPRIVQGREYIAALNRHDDATYGGLYAFGLYGWIQCDPGSGTIASLSGIGRDVSMELVWQIVSDLSAGLSAPRPDPSLKERWQPRLQTGDLHQFGAAVMVFDAVPGLGLEPGTLLDAFERHWSEVQKRMNAAPEPYPERSRFEPVVVPAFTLLRRIADEAATSRLLDLYVRDLSSRHSVFDHVEVTEPLARIVAQHGGGSRCDMLKGLLGREVKWASADGKFTGTRRLVDRGHDVLRAIAEYPGEDLDTLLLDMLHSPGKYGIRSALDLAGLWHGLVERRLPEVRAYLDEFLANPETFDLGVAHERSRENTLIYAREMYEMLSRRLPHGERLQVLVKLDEQGYAGALDRLMSELTENDTEMIPMLTEIPVEAFQDRHMAISFSINIARALPDPAFVPQLRRIAKVHPGGHVLAALDACGDGEHALALAKAELDIPVPRGDWRTVYDLINRKAGVVCFLGSRDDPALVPLVEPVTQAALLNEYREKLTSAARSEGREPHDYAVRGLERAAILALARCGGEQAVARLREVYDEGDIAARIAAAIGLYALEDDTGVELVRLFAEHRELENPEVKARWRIDLAGSFHAAATYLQNSRTDAILLERLKGGFSESDYNVVSYRQFVAQHEPVVLGALVDALDDADPSTRSHAHRLLKRTTGQDVAYDPNRPPQQQSEAIERWRECVEDYLQAQVN